MYNVIRCLLLLTECAVPSEVWLDITSTSIWFYVMYHPSSAACSTNHTRFGWQKTNHKDKTWQKQNKVFLLLCHYLNLRAWFSEKSECTFPSTWNETMKWIMQWFVLHEIVSHGLLGMSVSRNRHWDFSLDACTSEETEPYICCTPSPRWSYLILGAVDAQNS